MSYRKSESLKLLAAVAVGTLFVGQMTPASAKPMQSGQSNTENQSYPTRMNNQNRTTPSETMEKPAGANRDTRPTQSDGTNRTNATDRRVYQEGQTNETSDQMMEETTDNMSKPPAGTNVETRPTQSDGTNRTNATDRRIYNETNTNTNRSTTPNRSTQMNRSGEMNRSK